MTSDVVIEEEDEDVFLPENPEDSEEQDPTKESVMFKIKAAWKKYEAERSRQQTEKQKLQKEERASQLLKLWKEDLLPNWETVKSTKRVRELWCEGIPPAVRGQVWSNIIGNPLGLTREMFEACMAFSRSHRAFHANTSESHSRRESLLHPHSPTSDVTADYPPDSDAGAGTDDDSAFHHTIAGSVDDSGCYSQSETASMITQADLSLDQSLENSLKIINLDVSRTFPSLGLFQRRTGPYHEDLRQLLSAYVVFQPQMGYVQGMSFIAATLLLAMEDPFDAFVGFVHVLNRPCHHSLFSLDETEFMVYFHMYDCLFEYRLPKLYSHLVKHNLEPYIYLYDWMVTIFSRTLKLETRLLVWDLFFLDGEIALFQAALAIMHINEELILNSDFDQIATLLTSPMSEDMTPKALMDSIKYLNIQRSVYRSIESQVREKLAKKSMKSSVSSPNPADELDCSPCGSVSFEDSTHESRKSKNIPEKASPRSHSNANSAKDKKIQLNIHNRKLSVSLDRSVVNVAQNVFRLHGNDCSLTDDWSANVSLKYLPPNCTINSSMSKKNLTSP